ncbi:hypothetical protein ACFLQK_02830, partial [bacterium]
YTEIAKPDSTAGWERNIAPDGSYTVEEGGRLTEQHLASGITGVFDSAGEEDWHLDRNGNMVDDESDPDAPPLTEEDDTDNDGCHEMMDFDDNNNDNDENINFDDSDYNTNLLARYTKNISVNCVDTSPMFYFELAVDPSEGDAPLTVNAEVLYKGEKRSIEKFEWLSGLPGAAPVETTEPEITLVYDKYGTFILTVILHHKSGKQLVDTYPIVVKKPGAVTSVVELGTFDPGCTGSFCYTMDVDIDQYGNIFVLSENWDVPDRGLVNVLSGDETWLDSMVLETAERGALVNLSIDDNGFIYVLDSNIGLSVSIYNSRGTLVKLISLADFGEVLEFKGLAVADNGDIFVGRGRGNNITLIKCVRAEDYACSVLDQVNIASDDGFIGALDVDLDMTSEGNIAILAVGLVSYYTQEGVLISSFTPSGPQDVSWIFHLAIGPNDEVFVSDNRRYDIPNATIYVYDSDGNSLYNFEVPAFNWGMYVDKLGIIYMTTYDQGIVRTYAPEYIVDQAAGRIAARAPEVPGFNIRRVNVVPLDG